jgi:hypothetical protein
MIVRGCMTGVKLAWWAGSVLARPQAIPQPLRQRFRRSRGPAGQHQLRPNHALFRARPSAADAQGSAQSKAPLDSAAAGTRRCAWRIADLVSAERPASLYLMVPPSDISRTKPLIRLMLNQIGRLLTEDLQASAGRDRLLFMLDELPRKAGVGCARHRNRTARHEELRRLSAVARARSPDGVAAGGGAPAAHPGRDHAAAARRGARAGLWLRAVEGAQGPLFRRSAPARPGRGGRSAPSRRPAAR